LLLNRPEVGYVGPGKDIYEIFSLGLTSGLHNVHAPSTNHISQHAGGICVSTCALYHNHPVPMFHIRADRFKRDKEITSTSRL